MSARWVKVSLACFLMAGCGLSLPKPDPRPIEEALGTAMPVAYAASVALAAFSGDAPACVSFATPCDNAPCGGAITIDVDGCPLPLLVNAGGTVAVTGSWTGSDSLLMAAGFGDVSVEGRQLIIDRIDVFTANRNPDDTWSVVYVDQDITVNSSRQLQLQQSGWTLELDQGESLADPFDDIVVASGAMQAVTGTRVAQIGLANVRMDGDCLLNPLEGIGTYEVADADNITDTEITTMYFEDHCDGKVRVVVSVGVGIGSSGKLIDLDLLARN